MEKTVQRFIRQNGGVHFVAIINMRDDDGNLYPAQRAKFDGKNGERAARRWFLRETKSSACTVLPDVRIQPKKG